MDRRALSAALPATIPVAVGYLSVGAAFGLLLNAAGFGLVWALFMSVAVYAGSCQFLGVGLMAAGASVPQVAALTLLINFRHLVYGLSMLERFGGMGWRKPYLIFSLTDETYALLNGTRPPDGVDRRSFYFYIALLCQLYWVLGSAGGSLLGSVLAFDTAGIEFSMTALFLVIAVEQWKSAPSRLPALIGAGGALFFLLLAGQDRFLPPALLFIVAGLIFLQGRLDGPGPERGDAPCP